MKFKVRFNRRHNTYFTLAACGAGLWLMVTRFGLSLEQVGAYALMIFALLFVLVGMAALMAWCIRRFRDRDEL